jgi:hypothetical protein
VSQEKRNATLSYYECKIWCLNAKGLFAASSSVEQEVFDKLMALAKIISLLGARTAMSAWLYW